MTTKMKAKLAILGVGGFLLICPYTVGCAALSALAALLQITGGQLPL